MTGPVAFVAVLLLSRFAVHHLVGVPMRHAAEPPVEADRPVPPAEPDAQDSPGDSDRQTALSQLSAEARAKAPRRAKFVYRLPDGTVWDSYMYCEFREALRDFDATPAGAEPSSRARAWGFRAGSRRVAGLGERPHPLWHTLAPGRHDYLPFVYVNTAHATAADKGSRPMAQIEKEVADRWFVVYVQEYQKSEIGRLPESFAPLGVVRIVVNVPREVRARVGGSLEGEFFLVSDGKLERPKGAPDGHLIARYVHASRLRLNAEQYAAALLAREVEMIEWSFRRTTDRMGEKFEWSRRVVPVREAAQNAEPRDR